MIVRRYIVRGSVQGVGFRYFVQQKARELLLHGTVRNCDDGSVEIVAMGSEEQHSELSGHLHTGPDAAEVRGVEHHDAPMGQYSSFTITR